MNRFPSMLRPRANCKKLHMYLQRRDQRPQIAPECVLIQSDAIAVACAPPASARGEADARLAGTSVQAESVVLPLMSIRQPLVRLTGSDGRPSVRAATP